VAEGREEASLRLSVPVRRLATWLAVLIATFSVVSLVGQVVTEFVIVENDYADRIAHWLDVNAEASIPTWYATVTLLACSLLLGVIAVSTRRQGRPFGLQWALLAAGFALLSLEEVIGVHSQATKVLRRLADDVDGPVLLVGLGVVGLVGLLVVVLLFARWFIALPRQWRIWFAVGSAIYLAGVFGSDAVGDYLAPAAGEASLPYILVLTLEEALEMTGVLIIIVALLEYVRTFVGPVTVAVRDPEGAAAAR
jgi:hypothetical protein